MKVSQGFNLSNEKIFLPKETRSIESSSFQQMFTEKQSSLAKDHLNTLLKEIGAQGERLLRSRTQRDLHQYKKMIKSFLQEVVKNGLSLEVTTSFSSMTSRERKLSIIKEIDKKLLELSEEILKQQEENVRLLDKMGEIKGLLIDLYL